jgi:hypothetical protein
MSRKSKVPSRNCSESGWWIYEEVEQWVSKRQRKLTPKSKCLVWVNTRIIRAKNRSEAYRKALSLGQCGHPSKTHGGEWRFAGISMLLPVYDTLEDGAEVLWTVRGRISIAAIKKLVKTKLQLPVFDDREPTKPR